MALGAREKMTVFDAEIDLKRVPVSAKLADEIVATVLDVDGLAELFFEAARIERLLPSAYRKSLRACWPDVTPDRDLAYGYNATETRLAPATAREVKLYDWALALTPMLDAEDARLVWAAAHSAVRRRKGPAWTRLARFMHCHPRTAKAAFKRAIIELWYKLLYID